MKNRVFITHDDETGSTLHLQKLISIRAGSGAFLLFSIKACSVFKLVSIDLIDKAAVLNKTKVLQECDKVDINFWV